MENKIAFNIEGKKRRKKMKEMKKNEWKTEEEY